MFSPLVIDPDAAMDTDNQSAAGQSLIKSEDIPQMKQLAIAQADPDDQKNALPVIIGASYGSSFVGFVYFQQGETTSTAQASESDAMQARSEVQADLLFDTITGSMGVDAQTASMSRACSASRISSHIAR